ncbi:MAG: ABC transporter ATP-binding protein [Planctomycetales bacterium]|nr:ABC transporter ATP-binding protein [Planctomycetales bacterium]
MSAQMERALVETRGLAKRYGEVAALRDCSLQVQAGEIFGLLGPNGSGKSTLLRILTGMVRPSGGTATIDGLDCWRDSIEVRRRTSYLPGDARLPRWRRGRDVLKLFADARGGDQERSFALADRLRLDLTRRVGMMSTGMRQKLAIAVVMAAPTRVVILDEPTANLDPTVRMEILELVREAKAAGRTVLFSSHVLAETEEICDRVLLLRHGVVVHVQDMVALREGHRVWIPRHELSQPERAEAELSQWGQVLAQADGWRLDIHHELPRALQGLAGLGISSLRIEPLGLRTLYEQHFRGASLEAPPGGES